MNKIAESYNLECSAFGSDKNSLQHTFAGKNYMDHYAQMIGTVDNFRGKRNPKILEIGVLKGASLRMWQSLFPKAIVIGLDIQPTLEAKKDFTVIKGHQADPTVLHAINLDYGPFDFVVDDGSHAVTDMIATASYLIPFMAPNGLYVIEDTNVSWPSPFWPGMNVNDVPYPVNNQAVFYQFLSNIMFGIQIRSGPIGAIHHFHGMIGFDIIDENWKPPQA